MMGVLTPLFLLAASAGLIPIILHLFHRHDRKRLAFPALRYLLRMNKDHARTIRLRQILLLLLRICAILFLVIAGARPFLKGNQGIHEPTATVIILDNSMSSGLIRDGSRVLETLKGMALEGAEQSGEEDRLWLLKAAAPSEPAITGSLRIVQEAIRATEVNGTASNLLMELERAATILSSSSLPLKEIHLISDLQASSFGTPLDLSHIEEIPLIVSAQQLLETSNTYLDSLIIGGGMSPLTNETSHISVQIKGTNDNLEVPLRLVIDDQIYGVSNGMPGNSTVLPLGPFSSTQVTGFIETDPDFLSVDDRQFFVFQVRPPSRIATSGSLPFFLAQALPVLVGRERIQLHPLTTAEVHVSIGGIDLGKATLTNQTVVVIPPIDPVLLPGLNRSLLDAGIPWKYEISDQTGDSELAYWEQGPDMSGVSVKRHYQLISTASGSSGEVLIRLRSGEPWLVKGFGVSGPYILLASDLGEESTNLPVTAALIPFLDWILSEGTTSSPINENYTTGDPLMIPANIVAIRNPLGTTKEVREGNLFRTTGTPGIYQLITNDSTISRVAFNVPSQESILETIELQALTDRLPKSSVLVHDVSEWKNSVFTNRKGAEIWKWFVLIALIILIAETLLAASGLGNDQGSSIPTPTTENS